MKLLKKVAYLVNFAIFCANIAKKMQKFTKIQKLGKICKSFRSVL